MTLHQHEPGCPSHTMDAEESRDVEESLHGDGQAFARIVRRHQSLVARTMWRFSRNREDHEDLVQEVFIAAYTSLRSYRGEGPFASWLSKMAVRTGYAYWREQARERTEPREDIEQLLDQVSIEDSPHSAVLASEAVHQVLEQLAPRDRLVLTLLYLEEKTIGEVAQLTGWSDTMVKVQAWRAKGKLRRLLAEGGGE